MVPGFVDSGIKKLLHGCLNHDPSTRLTAVDCRQLLAFFEEMSEDQKTTVVEAIGGKNDHFQCRHCLLLQKGKEKKLLGSFLRVK